MFKKKSIVGYNPSAYSPNNIIPRLIEANSSVLDVGCGPGILGKVLKKQKKNCLCDGVDISKDFLRQARKYYKNLYCFDLDQGFSFGRTRYDFIVFADILEHLKRPDLVLKTFKKCLKRDGRIIISLPNVARLENRLNFLLGRFDYQECGIMHRDHLRFFTLKTGKELIEEAGFEVIKALPTGFGAMIKILPTLISFQFIYVCKRKERRS